MLVAAQVLCLLLSENGAMQSEARSPLIFHFLLICGSQRVAHVAGDDAWGLPPHYANKAGLHDRAL